MNEYRLKRHLAQNQTHTIHLLYDRTLLSAKGEQKLQFFLASNPRVNAIDLSELDLDGRENRLMQFVRMELSNEFGNAAAAADIIRWFKPVLGLGIYSDFDIGVDFRNIAEEVPVKTFLLSVDFKKNEDDSVGVEGLNNNILVFSNLTTQAVNLLIKFKKCFLRIILDLGIFILDYSLKMD